MVEQLGYFDAIKAISDTPVITCAYRLAWPDYDCIKFIAKDMKLPMKRVGRNGWGVYEPTEEDVLASDWVFDGNRSAR